MVRTLSLAVSMCALAAACGSTTGPTTTAGGEVVATSGATVLTLPEPDPVDRATALVEAGFGDRLPTFRVVELDMESVIDGLAAGEVDLPVVTRSGGALDITASVRQVQLRADGLTQGALRGEDGVQMVALTPEQNYWLGGCETSDPGANCGALTVIDTDQTMLVAAIFGPDVGASHIEAVDLLLGTTDEPVFPGLHVVYNAADTAGALLIDAAPPHRDGTSGAPTGFASARPRYQQSLTAYKATRVVLDADVSFYEAGKSTVWARQEAVLNVVAFIYWAFEGQAIDADPDTATWALRLRIRGQETWVSGGPTTRDAEELMSEITDEDYWIITPLDPLEMHYLFIGYDVADFAGAAALVGGFGFERLNRAFGEARAGITSREQYLIMAHELGHLLSGTHENAVVGCSSAVFLKRRGEQCGESLMTELLTREMVGFVGDPNDKLIAGLLDFTTELPPQPYG